MQVEFDPEKNAVNLKKHGVSLDEAAEGLLDPLALVREDGTAEGEARFVLVGMSLDGRLLTICYTLLEEEETIRLISGREATRREKRQYEEGI
ncbi:MAG TPA: BrnT family toxin [Thermoanaerobaculia bacterium]|nr:BrnT family toxin [Thermoanaerobaculia bacterium]